MKTRNLIIRLDSDQLRLGRLWLRDAISDPKGKDRYGQALLAALENVRDGGTLAGTPWADDETVPLDAQEAPGTAEVQDQAPPSPAPSSGPPAPPAKVRA